MPPRQGRRGQGPQDKLLQAGIEPETSTSDDLKAFVQSEIKKWAEIVKAAGIQPE